jgi:hypothetical protein
VRDPSAGLDSPRDARRGERSDPFPLLAWAPTISD